MHEILTSVKKLIGIDEDCLDFDVDILIHINTVINILKQMGVKVTSNYHCDPSSTWKDIFDLSSNDMSMIKSYMFLKVKTLFDPPTGGVSEAIKSSISELEWRINAAAETNI